MTRSLKHVGQLDLQYHRHHHPEQEMYAAIETDFGICVEMKNCAMMESFLENDNYCYPEDEAAAPLTLSWLSSRWHDSTTTMNRNVQKMPGFSLNNSRLVYQTTINYRRSLNLREGHDKPISEEVLNREAETISPMYPEDHRQLTTTAPPAARRSTVEEPVVRAGPKKMWIRHYYLSNGNGFWHPSKCKDTEMLPV